MTKHRDMWIVLVLVLGFFLTASPLTASGNAETDRKVLTVWTGNAEQLPVWHAAAADYMAQNPGVQVEITTFTLRESEQKFAISLPAGTAPDIFETSHFFARRFIEQDLFAPVPYVDWVTENYNQVNRELFAVNGQFYGVPWIQGNQLLFYNTEHYEAAGIPGPPQTLDALMEYARKLAVRDDNGLLQRSGISLRLSGGGQGVAEKFDIFLFANGGSVLQEVSNGRWRANFNNEAGYEALNFYLQALHKYRVDSTSVKSDAEAFVGGGTSQFNRETWVIGNARNTAPDLRYGIAPVVGGSERATNFVGNGLIVPATGANLETAWDFIRFISQDTYLVMMLGETGWIPQKNGVDYRSVLEVEPHFEQALNMPEELRYAPTPTASSTAEAYTAFSARLVEAFGIEELTDDRTAIMEFLQAAAEEVNAILIENGEYAE